MRYRRMPGKGFRLERLPPGTVRSPAGRGSVDDGVVPTESESLLEVRIDWDDGIEWEGGDGVKGADRSGVEGRGFQAHFDAEEET